MSLMPHPEQEVDVHQAAYDEANRRLNPTPEANNIVIEVVGDNNSFFRQITSTDLEDIARTFAADEDLQAAHDSLWSLTQPFAIANTGMVQYTVIDDSNDIDSCGESWLEIAAEFEEARRPL